MGLKTVKWLTISQFELREGRALRQTPSRRLQVLVSEHALRQTKLTPESHHRIACVTVRSEKQRRYPCSGPQPTQSITGSAFQISFILTGKSTEAFLKGQSWRVVKSWPPWYTIGGPEQNFSVVSQTDVTKF